jgi:hypothetical protein
MTPSEPNDHSLIREVSAAEEIANPRKHRPHVVILGAGASKAALPSGDRDGRAVPLLPEVAAILDLKEHFPEDLRDLAGSDFEAAYSRLYDSDRDAVEPIDVKVREYFQDLELPETVTAYDVLLLCLRPKDRVFTFNWDPFLLQAYRRLTAAGVRELPGIHFLHGCVDVGYCPTDSLMGLTDRPCSRCGVPLPPTRLLFPVEHKDYQDGSFIQEEWGHLREVLEVAMFFTIFGYSAPATDVEAIDLMKLGWGPPEYRQFEQTEIINRPDADEDALRSTWDPFIHTHHYEIHGSIFDSWLANHPRRSVEAFYNQYIYAFFIENNPVPTSFGSIEELIAWFQPLREAEESKGV